MISFFSLKNESSVSECNSVLIVNITMFLKLSTELTEVTAKNSAPLLPSTVREVYYSWLTGSYKIIPQQSFVTQLNRLKYFITGSYL